MPTTRKKLTWKPLLNLRGDPLGPVRGYSGQALIAEISFQVGEHSSWFVGQLFPISHESKHYENGCFFFGVDEEQVKVHAEEIWTDWLESAGLVSVAEVSSGSGGEPG